MSTIIQRHHLFAKLQRDALPRLIVISAAPGYGKTILAHQFATWTGYPVVWQRIDMWQRDAPLLHEQNVRFWSQQMPAIESELETGHQDVWQAAKQLLSLLEKRLDTQYLWVVDDVHHLVDSPQAEQWLQMQIDLLPPQIHIVLVGRYLPDLSWTQMVGHGLVANFNTEQLRFTTTEIQALFQLTEQKALELTTRFDGWIAGIRLAVNQQTVELSQYNQVDNHLSAETLFAEMAEMAFQQQPPDRQHFLLTTATLSIISPQICREVFGIEDIFPHLNALLERNLFILNTDDGYSYHDLFRQYLQQHLAKQAPQRFHDLHLQVAQWHEAQDEIDKAISHFVQAEAFSEARRLAANVAKEFHVMGRWENLLQFQELLQEQAPPLLQLYCANILTDRNQLSEAEILLQCAEQGFQQQHDQQAVIRVQLQLAFCRHRQGLYQQAIAQAQAILHLPELPEISQAWARRIIAWAQLELGNSAQAISEYESILPVYSSTELTHGRSHILQDMSSAYLRSGDFDKAGSLMQEVVALRRLLGNPHDLALALNDLGYYYHCQSQYQDALTSITEGLQLLQDTSGRTLAGLNWSLADVYRDLGQFRMAENHYLLALKLVGDSKNTLHSRILLSFARLRIWQTRFGDAQILLAESLRLLPTGQNILTQVIHILQDLIKILNQDTMPKPSRVIEQIDKLNTQQAVIKLAQLLGFYFYVAWQQNIIEMITHAQSLIAELPDHLYQALAAEVLNLPGLLAITQENKLMKLQSLYEAISTLQQHHTANQVQVSFEPSMMLELHILGDDVIHRDGQIIPSSAWTLTLARELFYYLYLNGSQSKEEIALIFWPEHNSKQVRTAIHNTIKRSRGAIPDGIIFDDGLYLINPALHIICDANQFRDFVQRARHLPPHDTRTADLYHRAMKLYQGDFLPTIFSDWASIERDKLQALYIQTLIGLGDCARTRQDFDTAIHYYQEAAEIDLYNEAIYRLIMTCHAHTGQFAKVKRVFDTLVQRLADDLAISPAPETQLIFWNLLSS